MSGAQSLIIPEVYTVQQALARCIEQLLYVIDLLPDEVYVAQDTPRDSSIGCHFRHVIEFMQMLGDQAADGYGDYELRNRVKSFERDRSVARTRVKENGRRLQEILIDHGLDYPLIQSQTPFVGAGKVQLKTSLGRELMYVIDHAIHHLALVRILSRRRGVELPTNIGLAAATQENMKKRGAAC